MEKAILYPCIPYKEPIGFDGKITSKTLVKIKGIVLGATSSRFNINFQCDPDPQDNIAIHISAQLLEGFICINSLCYGIWDEEQRISIIPIQEDEIFEIVVLFTFEHYKIIINGQYFKFPQRISYNKINYLCIDGDVSITQIVYESCSRLHSIQLGIENLLSSTKHSRSDTNEDPRRNTNIEVNSNSPLIRDNTSIMKTMCWKFYIIIGAGIINAIEKVKNIRYKYI